MKINFKKACGIIAIMLSGIIPIILILKNSASNYAVSFVFVALLIIGFLIYKIDEIIEIESALIKIKTAQKEIYAKADEVKQLTLDLHKDKRELREATRIFVESFYLSLETRNIFPIPEKIAKVIQKNINDLARFAIDDEKERSIWMRGISFQLKDPSE